MDKQDIKSLRNIHRDQFEVLYQISKVLNAAVYEESLIASALDMAIDFLNADRGLFCRYIPESDTFDLLVARNIQQNMVQNLDSFSSGVLRKVIKRKQGFLYHDAQEDPDISQFKSIQIHNIKSVIGVPVYQQDDVWGVILIDSQTNRREFPHHFRCAPHPGFAPTGPDALAFAAPGFAARG